MEAAKVLAGAGGDGSWWKLQKCWQAQSVTAADGSCKSVGVINYKMYRALEREILCRLIR